MHRAMGGGRYSRSQVRLVTHVVFVGERFKLIYYLRPRLFVEHDVAKLIAHCARIAIAIYIHLIVADIGGHSEDAALRTARL